MSESKEDIQKVARTYNATADAFDAPQLETRDHFGCRTIDRLALARGARVLDVCCGTGSASIPAAEAVGAHGFVEGIDLADKLLDLARAKAAHFGCVHTNFQCADMLALPFPDASFDAVVCVFGIFFVPDMPGAVRELWRFLRPGGKLAITTWGPRVREPANGAFWREIKRIRPELYREFDPWERINDIESLRKMLRESGIDKPEIILENHLQTLASPEDWWTVALGAGYRATIDQLTPEEAQAVHTANCAFLRDRGITQIETNALYAIATKEI
ncbi:MAG: class I SAM-dependent methyltransferase [Chthoniobacterales bacterium]